MQISLDILIHIINLFYASVWIGDGQSNYRSKLVHICCVMKRFDGFYCLSIVFLLYKSVLFYS